MKYVAVRDSLIDLIGSMEAGDRLPAEPALCERYGVSRVTVRRAMDELILSGHVVREQGRGTFVATPRVRPQVRETFADRITGFHRQQSELGRQVTTTVLRSTVTHSAKAAAALDLGSAAELALLERLRYVDGVLHQHVITYLPAGRYPAVLSHDFSSGSLYDFLGERYGVELHRNDLLVRLEAADDRIAPLLDVEVGHPLLAIDSTVFDGADAPVAFGTALDAPASSEFAFTLRSPATLSDAE